jgi:peptide/nickel transport system substrate-binding protein
MLYEMQNMLYEDLPSITLIYPKSLFGFKESIVGVNTLLLSASSFHSENWDDPADHVIKYAMAADLREWNSFVLESYYDSLWMQSVYGSLFRRNQNTREWEPYLAANYEISSDGLNYTVTLDPNAKFSDGSPVLAEDVDYTYELHVTPAVGSSRYSKVNTWFANNNSIQVVDPHTINFNFTAFHPFALDMMSYEIIDKSEIEPLITTYGYSIFIEAPLTGNVQDSLVKSCGPFMLDTFGVVNSTAKMIPNPYWDDTIISGGNQPPLDGLYFEFVSGASTAMAELIAGNIDIVDSQYYLSLEDFDTVGIEARTAIDTANQEIAINMRHPIIGTGELTPLGTEEAAKNIRKAISHAVPRQIIVDEILNGLGSPGITPMPPVCVGFNDAMQPYEYNLTLAREYIEDAGYELIEITPTPTTTTNFTILLIMTIGLTTICILRKRKR